MKRSPLVWLFILALFVAAPAAALDSGIENLRQTSKAFASVARKVTPSVVFVQVEGKSSKTPVAGFSLPL